MYKRQAYLNEKIGEVRKMDGFSRQSPEYQNLTIQLNLSDDYFKEQLRADDLQQQKEELEKDAYSLKHEPVSYTHLDVYKRQSSDTAGLKWFYEWKNGIDYSKKSEGYAASW